MSRSLLIQLIFLLLFIFWKHINLHPWKVLLPSFNWVGTRNWQIFFTLKYTRQTFRKKFQLPITCNKLYCVALCKLFLNSESKHFSRLQFFNRIESYGSRMKANFVIKKEKDVYEYYIMSFIISVALRLELLQLTFTIVKIVSKYPLSYSLTFIVFNARNAWMVTRMNSLSVIP